MTIVKEGIVATMRENQMVHPIAFFQLIFKALDEWKYKNT